MNKENGFTLMYYFIIFTLSLVFCYHFFKIDVGPTIKVKTLDEVKSEIIIPVETCEQLIERTERLILLNPSQKNWNKWERVSEKCQASEIDTGL